MKTLPFSILSMALLGGLPAWADVQPVNIVLHAGDSAYEIPEGKVLQIEHFMWALDYDATYQRVSIKPANDPSGVGDFQLQFTSDAPDSWTPPRPIRVVGGGGAKVSIYKNSSGVGWRDVMVIGLLIDPEDLYAGIETELLNPRVEDGRLVADVQYASPRPRVTKVESTPELGAIAFSEDLTAELVETTSPSKSFASISSSSDAQLMRARVVARMN